MVFDKYYKDNNFDIIIIQFYYLKRKTKLHFHDYINISSSAAFYVYRLSNFTLINFNKSHKVKLGRR
jgi:hypothetical protein